MNRIKRSYMFLVSFLLPLSLFAVNVSGTVSDAATGNALAGANVVVEGTDLGAAAGGDGSYSIANVPAGATITASMIGYTSASATAAAAVNFALEAGVVQFSGLEVIANRVDNKSSIAYTDFASEEFDLRLGSRGLPQALSLTPNVYVETNGGGYDDENVSVRGFTDNYTSYLINGIPVNDMENGNLYFSNWSVLADVGTSVQIQRGQSAVNLATPSVGGTINFVSTSPTAESKTLLKYMMGGDGYNKFSVNANSGAILGGKGNVVLVLAKRFADQYAGREGTYSDATSYYLNGSYALNNQHRIEFITLGSPQRHGHAFYNSKIQTWDYEYARELGVPDSIATSASEVGREYNAEYNTISSEAADLLDKNVARANWMPGSGWDFKEAKRQYDDAITARHNYFYRPITQLNHYFKASESLDIITTLLHVGGEGGGTGRYGYFPKTEDGLYRDFSSVIINNAANPMDSSGVALGLDASSSLATAVLRGSRNNHYTYGLMSKAIYQMNTSMKITAGLDIRTARIEHYRQIYDMLGGDYYYSTSNKNESGAELYKQLGDKIAYDFTNDINWTGFYGQLDYSTGAINAFGMLGMTSTDFKYHNRFAEGEIDAEAGPVSGMQVKAGLSYTLSENVTLFVNGGNTSLTPSFDKVIDDYAGLITEDYENEKATFMDVGSRFTLMNGSLSGAVNYYNTIWDDRQIRVSVENVSGSGTDGYANISGLNQTHTGFEYSFAYKPMEMLRFDLVGHTSNWEYTENVDADYYPDELNPDSTANYSLYIKGLKVGGAPQTQLNFITTAELAPFTLSAEIENSSNYYGNFSPTSRTSSGDEDTQAYKAPDRTLVNLHAAYSLDLAGYDVAVNLSVFNATNAKYLGYVSDSNGTITGAYVHMGLPTTWSLGLSLGL